MCNPPDVICGIEAEKETKEGKKEEEGASNPSIRNTQK
jgi:hypothetical protein